MPRQGTVAGNRTLVRARARRNPSTPLVVDQVGLVQPFEPPAPPETFADLANVLPLAEYDNVAIKISGACTLSHQPFPYQVIWEQLGTVFDAFGFARCMWGTAWTRVVGLLIYAQVVAACGVTGHHPVSERLTHMVGSLVMI